MHVWMNHTAALIKFAPLIYCSFISIASVQIGCLIDVAGLS